ncbi:hypothetical protein V1264_003823 [Littorina saxatilis]|uniref:BED-type domain-containing protein n=1 Tax=Littorina saxatilis TaxID=31220 RepID=A0AAN9B0R1_9CAEN
MMRKLKRDETVLAREIDQQKYKKNLWRFDWLDEVVSLSWKDEKSQKTQDVKLKVGDAFAKINLPGKAQCTLCNNVINYGSNGKTALKRHLKSNKHLTILKTQSVNQSLGSFGTDKVRTLKPHRHTPPLSLSLSLSLSLFLLLILSLSVKLI